MIERAVTFAKGGRLSGVLALPAPTGSPIAVPAVLLWNVGVNHHIGPYRFNVDLARALARRGFPSLRFDLGGLGDSEVRRDALGEMARALDDLHEAMALMETTVQVARFVPLGFCSSVDAAHQLTLGGGARVPGACFVEGYSFRTAGFYLRWPRRLLEAARWKRWAVHRMPEHLRRHLGLQNLVGNAVMHAEAEAVYVREYPSRKKLKADYGALVDRGARMLFIYVGRASNFNHQGQFFEMIGSRKLRGAVEVAYMADADHTFFRAPDRERAVTRVCAWMQREFGRPQREKVFPKP